MSEQAKAAIEKVCRKVAGGGVALEAIELGIDMYNLLKAQDKTQNQPEAAEKN